MRKAYISIAALLLCGSMLMAQTPEGRTAKTTAADVLAQMPAAKQTAYNKLIGDLSSTGEEGVLMLVNIHKTKFLCHGLSSFPIVIFPCSPNKFHRGSCQSCPT